MAGNFELLNSIGSGTYGEAWLARDKKTRKECVVKVIKILKLPEKELDRCLTEVSVLARCNHSNIVSYLDAFVDDGNLNIAMEYAEGGDLHKRIVNQKGIHFGKEVIFDWFVQICLAIDYIHSQNILHRDLKSQNIFLTSQQSIKLGDFGIARVLRDSADHAITAIGTPFYLSPEICQRKPYNYKSDMWALGCVLYELCCLHVPFNAKDFDALVIKILQGNFEPVPGHFGNTIEQLSQRLLNTDPDQRPSADEVLSLPSLQVYVKRHQQDIGTALQIHGNCRENPSAIKNSVGSIYNIESGNSTTSDDTNDPGASDENNVRGQGHEKQALNQKSESTGDNVREADKVDCSKNKDYHNIDLNQNGIPVNPSKSDGRYNKLGLNDRKVVVKGRKASTERKNSNSAGNVMMAGKLNIQGKGASKRFSEKNVVRNNQADRLGRNVGLREQRKYSSNTAGDEKHNIEGSKVKDKEDSKVRGIQVARDQVRRQKCTDKENIDPRRLSGKTFTVQNPKFRHLSSVTPKIGQIVARQRAALSADDDKHKRKLSEQFFKESQRKIQFESKEASEGDDLSSQNNPECDFKADDEVFFEEVAIKQDNVEEQLNKDNASSDKETQPIKSSVQGKPLPRRSTSCDNVTKVKQCEQNIGQRAMSEGDIIQQINSKTYIVSKQGRKDVMSKEIKVDKITGKRTVAVFIAKTFFTSILESKSSPTKAAAAIAARLTEMFGQSRVKELSLIVSQSLHEHQDFGQIHLKFTEKEMIYFPLVAQYVYLMNVIDSL